MIPPHYPKSAADLTPLDFLNQEQSQRLAVACGLLADQLAGVHVSDAPATRYVITGQHPLDDDHDDEADL